VGGVGSRVTAEVVAVGRLAFRRRKRRREKGAKREAQWWRAGERGRGAEREDNHSARRACGAGWVTGSGGPACGEAGNYCRLCWWWRLAWRRCPAKRTARRGAADCACRCAPRLDVAMWGLPRRDANHRRHPSVADSDICASHLYETCSRQNLLLALGFKAMFMFSSPNS